MPREISTSNISSLFNASSGETEEVKKDDKNPALVFNMETGQAEKPQAAMEAIAEEND